LRVFGLPPFDEIIEEAELEGPESLLFFTEERRLGLTPPPSLGFHHLFAHHLRGWREGEYSLRMEGR
jgi:hypothetical protein